MANSLATVQNVADGRKTDRWMTEHTNSLTILSTVGLNCHLYKSSGEIDYSEEDIDVDRVCRLQVFDGQHEDNLARYNH